MAEQPVFWLGGTPGNNKTGERKAPEAERYEPALRDACEACGFDVDEYVAAQGGFGGWLAHLERDGQPYRLFWNGRAGELRLEASRPNGWDVVRTAEQSDDGLPGFVEGIKSILLSPEDDE